MGTLGVIRKGLYVKFIVKQKLGDSASGVEPYVIEGRVKYVFYPPLFCPTKFVKSSDQFSERKNFEVPFFQKIDVFRRI